MQINVITIAGAWYHPFWYSALMFQKRFPSTISTSYKHGFINILIFDLFHSVKWGKGGDIAWLDTPCNMESLKQPLKVGFIRPKWTSLYVTCEWNRVEAQKVGLKVDDVIYRFINDIAFNYDSKEKKKDIITIGAQYPYDRKNLKLLAQVKDELNLNFEALTDSPYVFPKIRRGSFSDEDKFKWISQAKWLIHIPYSGSFEMPVCEAMACGVPTIYSEIPVLKEYAVGIPVKVGEHSFIPTLDGNMHKWSINKEDVKEAVKYALGLGKDAYNDLSIKAREKARAMQIDSDEKFRTIFASI